MPKPSPGRWRRIDRLFHSTLSLPPAEREPFLRAQCGSDRPLLDEVLSLVHADAVPIDTSYEDWAPRVAAAWVRDTGRSLTGRTVGRYRVLELLGSGAMGQVYRAEDPALGRHVALKTLHPVAGDAARLRRLDHEARAASALNHPNILTIHEIGETDGVPFIAAELVEGETLRDRLARGALSLVEAVDIAGQVAAGLGVAHAAGLIHRDIKPENVMVRRDGLVKIVDFGLAEPIGPSRPDQWHGAAASDVDHQPAGTPPGIAGGTLSYMSPEQAGGGPLDTRTDLYSLGVVFYEMVTGRVPFERGPGAGIRDGLRHGPAPRPTAITRSLPRGVDAVVARALEKKPEHRYQTAIELEQELERLRESASPAPEGHSPADSREAIDAGSSSPRPWNPRRLALGALGIVAIAGGLAWSSGIRRGDPPTPDSGRLAFVRVTRQAGEELFPSLAPGGEAVVYASAAAGNWDIYRQPVNGSPVNLTRDSAADDLQPVFAPDGQRILFRSERHGGGLFVMPSAGGSATRVSDIGWDPAWSPDGRQIVCSTARVEPTTVRLPDSQLWVVEINGGRKRLLFDGPAYQPQWSPSGERIAFSGPDATGQRDLWTIDGRGGEPVRVTTDRYLDWNPVWSGDGRYLYFLSDRDGTMNAWRMAIDQATGRALGEPRPFTLPAVTVVSLARAFGSDALTWASRVGGGVIRRYAFDPVNEAVLGEPVTLTSPSRSLGGPDLSPDDTLLAANTRGEAREDIVILRTDGTQVRALTEDEPRDRYPRWSPDGRRVAFWSDRSGSSAIFLIDQDGSRLQPVVQAGDRRSCCPLWSPDGRYLAYLAGDLTIHAIDLQDGTWRDRLLAKLPAGVWFQPVSWSSDGSRLAGQERRGNKPGGGVAVYDLTTHQYSVLTPNGGRPIWLNDDRRLIYTDEASVFILDTSSGQSREILSVAPHQNSELTVTRDNRHLYVSVSANEADVWITTPRQATR